MPVDTKKTASQIGAEAASVLVATLDAGDMWFRCFEASLTGVCSGHTEARDYIAPTALTIANKAYAEIQALAQQHRDSLVVR